MTTTTIKVTKEWRDFIATAANRYNKSIGEFVYQSVFFVHKHRYDPYQMEDVKIAEEFKKLKTQLTSFIKTQERNHIIPMHETIRDMAKQFVAYQNVMEEMIIQHSKLDDLSDSDLPPYPNPSEDRERSLEADLKAKSELIKNVQASMERLREVSLVKKKEVVLKLSEEEFQKLTSLV